MDKNLALYIGIAVVVVAIVLVGTLVALNPTYDVTVRLLTNSTPPVYPYQTAHLGIVLFNKGPAVHNLLVGFYVNGAEQGVYNITLPSGKTPVAIETNYSFVSNGTYQFTAVADPAHILPMRNRSATSASLSINVTPNQKADIFTAIPNNGINFTQSFSLANLGLVSSSAIAVRYNVSIFNNLFPIPGSMLPTVAADVSKGIAYANGAYVQYSNGTAAYTLWLQGFIAPQDIQYLMSTFQVPATTVRSGNSTIAFMKVSNTTSVCTFYDRGWTKVISYYNMSLGTTCAGIAASTYQPTEANVLVGALKSNPNATRYMSRFVYTNTTQVGTYIAYSNPTSAISLSNMFYNNFGFFTTMLEPNPQINASNATPTCRGLVYNNATTNVCSVYMLPRDGVIPNGYALVNSTQLGPQYLIRLFSLVNSTQSTIAHVNAAALIRSLNISQNTTKWGYAFKNTCSTGNSSIGCTVTAFDYVNNTAFVDITSSLADRMTLNTASCAPPGLPHNVSVNATIGNGQAAHLRLPCVQLYVPVVSAATSYAFTLNYTYHGVTRKSVGYLNVTNPGFAG